MTSAPDDTSWALYDAVSAKLNRESQDGENLVRMLLTVRSMATDGSRPRCLLGPHGYRAEAKVVIVRSIHRDTTEIEWWKVLSSFAAARRWLRSNIADYHRADERIVELGCSVWSLDLV